MFTPLSDLTVLDLSRYLPGPFLTRVLADLGARVIKVEPPAGDPVRWMPPMRDGVSALYTTLNAGKQSLIVDLKRPEGQAIVRALALRADVLVESFRPGVLTRLNLDPADLRREHPGLIIASLSGYGQHTSKRSDAGHDLDYIARAGLLAAQGPAGQPPTMPAIQMGDVAGGAWPAAVGILAALRERDRTGQGRHLDVSLARGAMALATMSHAAAWMGEAEPRGEGMLTGGLPCYNLYPAADGWLAVGALEPQFWAALCVAVGRPDLAALGFSHGEEGRRVHAELSAIFAKRTRAAWTEALRGLDTCVEPVATALEALHDPDLAPSVAEIEGFVVLRPDTGALADLAPLSGGLPSFGGDAAAILADLSPALVQAAREAGAIVLP